MKKPIETIEAIETNELVDINKLMKTYEHAEHLSEEQLIQNKVATLKALIL